jgi:hypothetical protein
MMKQLHKQITSWAGLLLLAALLISCAKESSVVDTPEVKQPTQPTQSVQAPIALSAYTAKPTVAGTRADQELLAEGGIPNGKSIGVYAYYHQGVGDTPGAWSASAKPDFMFNQKATNNAEEDGFSYSPLKYWPNTNHDKLSFIGYYPYTTTFSGSTDANGIVLTKGSDDEGLPAFELTVSDDVTKQVDFLISDLLTDLPNGTSAVSPSSATYRDAESGYLTIVDKVRLLFHHATSKVTIRIAVDDAIREDFMSMTISNLELTNIYRKGTVTPSYAPATGTTIDVTGASESRDYQIVDASVNPIVNHLTDTYLMLPQTLAYVENDAANTANLNITYSVTLRSHGTVYTYDDAGNPVETDHYTYGNTASLPLAKLKLSGSSSEINTWLPNHHYIYTIRLTANRIEFTGEVVEWGDQRGWDGVDIEDVLVNQIGGS